MVIVAIMKKSEKPKLPLRQHQFIIELARLIEDKEKITQARFMHWFDDASGKEHKFTNSFVSKTFAALRDRRKMIHFEPHRFNKTVRLLDRGRKYVASFRANV